MFPAEFEQGDTLPSCFSSHTANGWTFHGLLIAMFFVCVCISPLLLLEMAFKHRAKVLCSRGQKCCDVHYREIRVLDKLYPGISQSAIGCEFSVMDKPYILNKVFLNRNACKTRLCIEQLTKMLKAEDCRILNPHYPKEQGLLVQCSRQLYRTKLPWIMRINCIYININIPINIWDILPAIKHFHQYSFSYYHKVRNNLTEGITAFM